MDKAQIFELLEQLSVKVGVVTEALWGEAIRYVFIDGLVGAIFWGAMGVVTTIVAVKCLPKGIIAAGKYEDSAVVLCVGGGLSALIAPFAFGGMVSGIIQALAPAGYLVMKVLGK